MELTPSLFPLFLVAIFQLLHTNALPVAVPDPANTVTLSADVKVPSMSDVYSGAAKLYNMLPALPPIPVEKIKSAVKDAASTVSQTAVSAYNTASQKAADAYNALPNSPVKVSVSAVGS